MATSLAYGEAALLLAQFFKKFEEIEDTEQRERLAILLGSYVSPEDREEAIQQLQRIHQEHCAIGPNGEGSVDDAEFPGLVEAIALHRAGGEIPTDMDMRPDNR